MEIDREQLLQLKSGENRYNQFYVGKEFDMAGSIFEHITQTIDLLIKQIDQDTPVPEIHAFLRKRFLKMGWHKFLEDLEYVRPNDPENKLHDAVNKSYYDQMAKAVGLNNFLEYVANPKKNSGSASKSNSKSLRELDELSGFHEKEVVKQIKNAFIKCLKDIDLSGSAPDKKFVIQRFEKLLDEITEELDVYDTEDREVIAEVVEECLIHYGFSDSDGMLGRYV